MDRKENEKPCRQLVPARFFMLLRNGASLDSGRQICVSGVRSKGFFGQRVPKFALCCPKLGHLRTKNPKITAAVSEVRAAFLKNKFLGTLKNRAGN
jgi:hypothetical protein